MAPRVLMSSGNYSSSLLRSHRLGSVWVWARHATRAGEGARCVTSPNDGCKEDYYLRGISFKTMVEEFKENFSFYEHERKLYLSSAVDEHDPILLAPVTKTSQSQRREKQNEVSLREIGLRHSARQ